MVQLYSGILHNCRRGWSPDTPYIADELRNHYAKWKTPDTKATYCMTLFTWNVQTGKSTEAESRSVVARGWRVGWEWLSMDKGFSLGWWKSSGMRQRWWLHNIVNVLNSTELFTLKWWFLHFGNFTSVRQKKGVFGTALPMLVSAPLLIPCNVCHLPALLYRPVTWGYSSAPSHLILVPTLGQDRFHLFLLCPQHPKETTQ